MVEKIIKSTDRVKDIGEVFTPNKTVDFMLDQPEIAEKVNTLDATFLEPSAGEGAFLVEILKRKLNVAAKKSTSIKDMQNNFLLALSSLYGIEFMEDNIEMLVMNMNSTFQQIYFKNFRPEDQNNKILKSAEVIISANMVQGNTLTRKTIAGDPIIFSEWKPVEKNMVQRTEYTFDSIIEGGESTGTVQPEAEQLSMFDNPYAEGDTTEEKEYSVVKWEDIYKRLVE